MILKKPGMARNGTGFMDILKLASKKYDYETSGLIGKFIDALLYYSSNTPNPPALGSIIMFPSLCKIRNSAITISFPSPSLSMLSAFSTLSLSSHCIDIMFRTNYFLLPPVGESSFALPSLRVCSPSSSFSFNSAQFTCWFFLSLFHISIVNSSNPAPTNEYVHYFHLVLFIYLLTFIHLI
jgi:hypothetical protein